LKSGIFTFMSTVAVFISWSFITAITLTRMIRMQLIRQMSSSQKACSGLRRECYKQSYRGGFENGQICAALEEEQKRAEEVPCDAAEHLGRLESRDTYSTERKGLQQEEAQADRLPGQQESPKWL